VLTLNLCYILNEPFIGIIIVVNLSIPIPASTLPEMELPMTLSLSTLTVDGPQIYFNVARPFMYMKQNLLNELIKESFNLRHTFRLSNHNACSPFRTDPWGIVAGDLYPITYIAGHYKRYNLDAIYLG
jgi:hypothetical protein